MIDTQILDETIEELERGPISFNLCGKLASLYIVKEHLNTAVNNENNRVVAREYKDDKPKTEIKVENELSDILPQYKKYIEIKRKYQMHNVTEEAVERSILQVCNEIREFIQTLYSSTDLPVERQRIREMLNTLISSFSR